MRHSLKLKFGDKSTALAEAIADKYIMSMSVSKAFLGRKKEEKTNK